MKRRNQILGIILGIVFALMSTIPVMASELEAWDISDPTDTLAWTSGTSISGSTRIDSGVNSLGQSFYRFYNNGNLEVEIFTRGGNIWNNTTQTLLTTANKAAGYLMIDSSYNVYGVVSQVSHNGRILNNVATQYDRYFTSGSTPRYLTEHPGVISFQTDSNGIGIGIYTADGLYSIAEDRIISSNTNSGNNNNNYNPNDSPSYNSNSTYPRMVQSRNNRIYYVSSNNSYTYTLSSYGQLTYKKNTYSSGTVVSSGVNEDIQCGISNYLVYTRTNGECRIVAAGSTSSSLLCNNFAEYIYDGSQYNRVIGAKDAYGRSYWIERSNHYSYDYDYDNYPEIYRDDDYTYYNDGYETYQYRLTNGKLYYNSKLVASNVEEIAFGDGYMIYVVGSGNSYNYKQTAKVTQIGSTKVIKSYSNFEYFEQDDDGLVTEIVTNSRSYDIDDWN